MLPVSSLREPPSNLLLRDVNNVFTAALKRDVGEFNWLVHWVFVVSFPDIVIALVKTASGTLN